MYSLILFLIVITMTTQAVSQHQINNPSGFEIKRGVNLSHWLSQNFGWSPKATFITDSDIKFIDSIGYDHVRIPIDEQEMWDESGKPIEESFRYLTHCLDWCANYKLRAIVDLHILRSHYFNAANEGGSITLWTDTSAQNTFINLWIQISQYLHKYPVNMVAYELMNEPVANNPDDWNKLIEKTIKTIRLLEPERVLVIGSNMWQIPSTFPNLKVPLNDKNIILSTHTYSPLHFTHYLAEWVPSKRYTGPVHYPGQIVTDADYEKFVNKNDSIFVKAMLGSTEVYNKQRLTDELLPAIKKAEELHLQLYCGEFGCLPHVNRKDRLRYYDDIISIFHENNIAWCNWEYKGDFGIFSFDFKNKISLSPDVEFIKTLLKDR
jgi:endoglucanase